MASGRLAIAVLLASPWVGRGCVNFLHRAPQVSCEEGETRRGSPGNGLSSQEGHPLVSFLSVYPASVLSTHPSTADTDVTGSQRHEKSHLKTQNNIKAFSAPEGGLRLPRAGPGPSAGTGVAGVAVRSALLLPERGLTGCSGPRSLPDDSAEETG